MEVVELCKDVSEVVNKRDLHVVIGAEGGGEECVQ